MARSKKKRSNAPSRKTSPSSQHNAAQQTTDRASFLDLPGELRNNIYHLALDDTETVFFPEPSASNKKGRAQEYPKFLMASKQIYAETRSLFYSKTTFHFTTVDKTLIWLRKLGNKNRSYVRNVIVEDKIELGQWPEPYKMNSDLLFEHLRMIRRRTQDAGLALKPGSLTLRRS